MTEPAALQKLRAITMDLHDRLMPRVRDRLVIDVGANVGGYTHMYLTHSPRLVVAVEPGPRMAETIRTRFAEDRRVAVECAGISDRPGKLAGVKHHHCWTLARPGEFDGRITSRATGAEELEGQDLFDVELLTLDVLVERYAIEGDVAFVKIDTDGYEAKALRGAEQTMKIARPPMLLELSYMPQDIGDDVGAMLDQIYERGYVIATMDGRVATRQQVWDGYPWHTSYDVMVLPVELASSLALPAA